MCGGGRRAGITDLVKLALAVTSKSISRQSLDSQHALWLCLIGQETASSSLLNGLKKIGVTTLVDSRHPNLH